jgi:glycosyltransferase involved in cell wall biosynthesis
MQKPTVSILMASYNNVAYIKAAIESVQAQTYKNWELIIVDDFSTDGSFELATVLIKGDERIKLFRQPENYGVHFTMMKASSLATGELRAHLDSDDMLERYSVDEMVLAFEVNPKIMFIYSDIAQIDRKGNVELYSASKTYNKTTLHQHGWRHFGMYRASVFEVIQGYNEQLTLNTGCIDGDLFMQIAEKFPDGIKRLQKVLYLYRSHGNNFSANKPKCEECQNNPVCNYIRVWAKSENRDQATLKPLEKTNE